MDVFGLFNGSAVVVIERQVDVDVSNWTRHGAGCPGDPRVGPRFRRRNLVRSTVPGERARPRKWDLSQRVAPARSQSSHARLWLAVPWEGEWQSWSPPCRLPCTDF